MAPSHLHLFSVVIKPTRLDLKRFMYKGLKVFSPLQMNVSEMVSKNFPVFEVRASGIIWTAVLGADPLGLWLVTQDFRLSIIQPFN